MKKTIFFITLGLIFLGVTEYAFAERDWEYWSRYSFEAPITKTTSYSIKPEWRIKNDMLYKYLFELEQAINFKIGKYFELAPYYVWQEAKAAGGQVFFIL